MTKDNKLKEIGVCLNKAGIVAEGYISMSLFINRVMFLTGELEYEYFEGCPETTENVLSSLSTAVSAMVEYNELINE